MNIEEKIRNNREAFDDVKMPEGSRERFEVRLRRDAQSASALMDTRSVSQQSVSQQNRSVFMTWTSIAAAAAIAVFVMIAGLKFDVTDHVPTPQVAENQKLMEMRQMYDEKVEEAIINLENVMENVDDSTKMQINTVIRDLMNMGDVFAEMAPMPEDRQMAITEQMYDNKLRTLDLITKQINK